MANSEDFVFESEGELEVAILHENHNALATIIHPDLYKVVGDSPDQNIVFHNNPCFELFLVRVIEIFAAGSKNATINKKNYNHSLFSGAQWLCEQHEKETKSVGLNEICEEINDWIESKKYFSFWCGELGTQFEFELTRLQLIYFGGNIFKHNLFRLNIIMKKLLNLCKKNGYNISTDELVSVIEPFSEELSSRLKYHSTYLAEILGKYFQAINQFIINRFNIKKTNKDSEMNFPDGVVSNAYKNLYGSTIVFHRYEEERIKNFTPTTSESLKKRY
jgi:hypothetical protein